MSGRRPAFWVRDVEPLLREIPPRPAFILLVGCAMLINKRYLADDSYGGPAVVRWQTLAAWLVGSVVLTAGLRAHRAGRLPWWLPGILAALAMAAAMAPAGFLFGDWRLGLGEHATQLGMMLLALLVLAPAALACGETAARPAAGHACAAVGLVAAGLCLAGLGPLETMLIDARVDKLNWGLLSGAWLLIATYALTLPVLGGRLVDDGGGLGDWRFWLPWTLGLLVGMVLIIVLVAGRQPDFLVYYPMYRHEWGGYNPLHDGWGFYLAYSLAFGVYFLAWEGFFRGWMLFRLDREIGGLAVIIQTIPFVIMHIGKPGLELHSSLVAGVVLGWLAWRGRSFWPCFLLHWGAAACMDAVAMLRGLA